MPTILRKIIIAGFLLTTAALTSTLLYSTYLYYGIYRATRDVNIGIQRFNVEVFNVSYVIIQTEILIENPSEYMFQVVTIAQRFWLNGRYISTMNVDLMKPADINPTSDTTFMSQQRVPSHLTLYVAEQTARNWIAEINAMMEFPLIGSLVLKFHDQPSEALTNSE